MNVRKIRIKTKLVREQQDSFSAQELVIPKTYITKVEGKKYYSRTTKSHKENWTIFTIDEDFLRDSSVLLAISELKEKGRLYVYGRKSFGIDWDVVLDMLYSHPADKCFYCSESLIDTNGKKKRNKTKDHLVAKEILKAHGLYSIPDNTVPCCTTCNGAKGSLTVYLWRVKLKTMIKERNKYDWKWRRALKVMNRILIDKTDPKI